MAETIYDLGQAVLYRFLRGALSGAVASMATLAVFSGGTIKDVQSWLAVLAIAGATGAISGGILALDKYRRDKDKVQTLDK